MHFCDTYRGPRWRLFMQVSLWVIVYVGLCVCLPLSRTRTYVLLAQDVAKPPLHGEPS